MRLNHVRCAEAASKQHLDRYKGFSSVNYVRSARLRIPCSMLAMEPRMH